MQDHIHNKIILLDKRRELRHNLTPAEAVLWKAIQQNKLENRKFRRQHSVGNYILDFYCATERLAIELDGAHHFTFSGAEYDNERSKYLSSLNIRVLRFENKVVLQQLELVLEEIKKHLSPSI